MKFTKLKKPLTNSVFASISHFNIHVTAKVGQPSNYFQTVQDKRFNENMTHVAPLEEESKYVFFLIERGGEGGRVRPHLKGFFRRNTMYFY